VGRLKPLAAGEFRTAAGQRVRRPRRLGLRGFAGGRGGGPGRPGRQDRPHAPPARPAAGRVAAGGTDPADATRPLRRRPAPAPGAAGPQPRRGRRDPVRAPAGAVAPALRRPPAAHPRRRPERRRAPHGPEKDVFFSQARRPGRPGASDFTHRTGPGVTIAGAPFPHPGDHFVLTYSNREAGLVRFAESFEVLGAGPRGAPRGPGGVPEVHRTDGLTAAAPPGSDRQRRRAPPCHYGPRDRAINLASRGLPASEGKGRVDWSVAPPVTDEAGRVDGALDGATRLVPAVSRGRLPALSRARPCRGRCRAPGGEPPAPARRRRGAPVGSSRILRSAFRHAGGRRP